MSDLCECGILKKDCTKADLIESGASKHEDFTRDAEELALRNQ